MVDSSVLIDYLRDRAEAGALLEQRLVHGPLHASEFTRLEILAGMRAYEETRTRATLSALVWHPVDEEVAERAGALGRRWRPSHGGIDTVDLAVAATAELTQLPLLTLNVRHFPMFPDLRPPY